jgi:chemotaxis protein CheY-P-specific phosphatase CheC
MNLTSEQMDALQELGNIGAAHAATTLSTMLNTSIEMNVPEISVIDLSRIHEYISDEIAAMVLFRIDGELSPGGYLLLHVPVESAIRLVNVMLGEHDMNRAMNEMDRSALLEIGNIMVSAFLDATAGLLNTVMIPSPPDLVIDMPHAALQVIITSQLEENGNNVVLFRTELKSSEYALASNLLLLPNPPVLKDMIHKLERLLSNTSQR